MMRDALVAADPYFDFLQNLRRPEVYRHWTDSIVKRIERSKDARLKDSQAIIDRINRRDIYKYIDGIWLESPKLFKEFKE